MDTPPEGDEAVRPYEVHSCEVDHGRVVGRLHRTQPDLTDLPHHTGFDLSELVLKVAVGIARLIPEGVPVVFNPVPVRWPQPVQDGTCPRSDDGETLLTVGEVLLVPL